jgi:hypothetical protein
VLFFNSNETVFTTQGVAFNALLGLHEGTQVQNAMEKGINNGYGALADLGTTIQTAAIEAAYGATTDASAVEKCLAATIEFRRSAQELTSKLLKESQAESDRIAASVENGKRQYAEILATPVDILR